MSTETTASRPATGGNDDATIVQLYDDARKIGRAIIYDLGDNKKSRSVTEVVNSVFRRYILPNREEIEALAKEPQMLLALLRTAIRNRLTDYARMRRALKRPPADKRVTLENLDELVTGGFSSFVEKHLDRAAHVGEALEELKNKDLQAFEVVELKYFIGFNHDDIARLRGVSTKTVQRLHNRGIVALERIIRRMEQ